MSGTSLLEELRGVVAESRARVWMPLERLPFVSWCEKNVVIRPSEAPEAAGPYRPDKALAMARLFELFDEGDEWRSLAIEKGAQSTATFHALALIAKKIHETAGNVVYVIHSAEEAANISKRLQAVLEDCRETGSLMEETDSDDIATRVLRLPGKTIWITGAGSAGALASKPGVALMIADEVDKHKHIKGEAETLKLVEQRGKTLKEAKQVSFSTPTTADGQIHRAYMRGSRHRYFVSCPFCEVEMLLESDRLRFGWCKDLTGEWDLERVRKEATCECPSCHKQVGSEHKRWMVERGVWRPTNFRELKSDGEDGESETRQVAAWVPGAMSAQISDFYYFWSSSSFGELAVKKIEASKDPLALHDFLNNYCGEPVKESGMRKVEEGHVLSLRGAYKRGSVPKRPAFVTFAADTQDDRWKWALCAWSERGDCWVVDYGDTMAFRDVMEIARDGVEFEGERFGAKFCLVDEGGHRTREVRGLVAPLRPWMHACKGQAGRQINHVMVWRDFDVTEGGYQKIPVLNYDDPTFKRLLYRERILPGRKRDDFETPKLYLPADTCGQFAKELCGEQLVREADPKTGALRWRWKQTPPNDFGDALKMNYIAYEQAKSVGAV